MLFFCFRATIPKVATTDRQAKLSSLRYLLTDLVEQLAEPEFDVPGVVGHGEGNTVNRATHPLLGGW